MGGLSIWLRCRASTKTVRDHHTSGVEDALGSIWTFIAKHGELRNLAIPLIGTGRGRIGYPRKKMVERIAQYFAASLKDKIFSNRLSVVVRPKDAENFGVNLCEIRDHLMQSLHS